MFKVQEKGKPETAIWLTKENTIISNDGGGDLSFKTSLEDTSKLKIQVDGEKVYLADLTFNIPIFFNGKSIPAGSKRSIHHGDEFRVGDSTFEVLDPKAFVPSLNKDSNAQDSKIWQLKAVGNWLDGQVFNLSSRTVIGRDNSCDITIPGSHLSRRHAEFIMVGKKLLLRDLDSANGSFVNGKPVKEATLVDGDMIKLDILSFRVLAPEGLQDSNKAATHPGSVTETGGPRAWKTKPTSIGNRENDSLDIILAEHQRKKRIIHWTFGSLSIAAIIVISYLLSAAH